jgi:CBS domain-containing protein
MQLREIMTRDVEVIRPETSVSEAAQKMRSLDLGALPVCDGQRLVGMVTDRHITVRATAYGHDPKAAPVRNYMSSDLICCFEDQDIKEAEHLMRERHVRRLPVLTREKQVAGMIALDDLASRPVGAGHREIFGKPMSKKKLGGGLTQQLEIGDLTLGQR